MRRKSPKPKLIDDTDFLIRRVTEHERKPDEAIDSPMHREWIGTLPCHACGTKPVKDLVVIEAAHLRKGAGEPKGGGKKDDYWVWPGCPRCHRGIQHQIGEDSFWERRLGDMDRWRTVLERYGLKSPCPKTRAGAIAEYERRYGRAA